MQRERPCRILRTGPLITAVDSGLQNQIGPVFFKPGLPLAREDDRPDLDRAQTIHVATHIALPANRIWGVRHQHHGGAHAVIQIAERVEVLVGEEPVIGWPCHRGRQVSKRNCRSTRVVEKQRKDFFRSSSSVVRWLRMN